MNPIDEVRELLRTSTPEQRKAIFDHLRIEFPIHSLEKQWNVTAEIILEAIDRASDLTKRGIRGVIAEAAFGNGVIDALPEEWASESIEGDAAFDYLIRDSIGPVRIQVKLQRREQGKPKLFSQRNLQSNGLVDGVYYVVETQRTRTGTNTATGEGTRPYRYGSFDIIAVSLHPSTDDWSSFMMTVGDWLLPSPKGIDIMNTYQPVPPTPSGGWTDNLLECIDWFRQGVEKRICQS
jgi:hypothetical protein